MSRHGGVPTPLYRLYCGLTAALGPLAWWTIRRKLVQAGVSPERRQERLGHPSLTRAPGPLIWFHAASVGESLSVLTLITRMARRLPQHSFLITSGTPTSARLIAKRLPPRSCHQFAPIDAAGPLRRFYAHWRPQAGLFVESELWPRMIVEGRRRGLALALINARLSDGSVRKWRRFPKTAGFLLEQFDLFLTQNRKSADNLLAMGADPARVQPGTNLKALSDPLPVDEVALARIRRDIGARPVWVASSTHPGEEAVVLDAHKRLLADHPELLLILVPRHPERGPEVAAMIEQAGLTGACRSAGEAVTEATQVFMADTLGETGTWYALCPLVFMGGSLERIGGHNPFEPAQAGAAVLTGPGFFNFAETYAALIAGGGAVEVNSAAELHRAVNRWLTDDAAFAAARQAASQSVAEGQAALDAVVETLCKRLGLD
ncbi:3-deoxy-D-manno-octulosonic-acid transferase [Cribrihabitans marinus]|uniref:3-deoxy-D-manno-octulosonic acid transferase n=1 Tax=Cribrihabitans marinus TaxID=1227549 RepID=A0A1H6TPL3_9RHOB|nr:3-deoxy-D-manno-octulosonic acid transferase [Cribrihabitans marinus]GGH21703.1 3-deoxy-D-manno-octulosonic acid transferase [Cribrihabitans marinus]SEI80144.1 3-deoxy-D-manno-octulosonic-acid transferase [Cribrihabitans marinus]